MSQPLKLAISRIVVAWFICMSVADRIAEKRTEKRRMIPFHAGRKRALCIHAESIRAIVGGRIQASHSGIIFCFFRCG
jgi:hypothetical protein